MGTRTGRSEQAEAPLVNEGAAEGLREAYRLVSRQARWSGDGERGFDVGEGHAWREGGKEAGMGSRSDPIRSTDSQVWIIKIRNWIEEGDGVCTSPGIQHHQLPSERVASAARIRSKKKPGEQQGKVAVDNSHPITILVDAPACLLACTHSSSEMK
jgi:hypothetical protein